MIRNDAELRETLRRIEEGRRHLEEIAAALRAAGASEESIATAEGPMKTFLLNYEDDVKRYEDLKRGVFVPGRGLAALGRILVEARIAGGLTQRELADRLGVHESAVSRDERNDYFGVTVDRARRILEATGIRVGLTVARSSGGPAPVEPAAFPLGRDNATPGSGPSTVFVETPHSPKG